MGKVPPTHRSITIYLRTPTLYRLALSFFSFLALTLFTACSTSPSTGNTNDLLSSLSSPHTIPPEAASNILKQAKTATGKKAMVVTANPYATQAAFNILQQGGSATDAAITAQLVLGLVEPQSSGIGGGAFLLHWDNTAKQLITFDGRETAPAAINENHFLVGDDQQPMNFFDALVGGYSVGTPGIISTLEAAHKQYGKLPWHTLFQPAIALAETGFTVSPRLNKLLNVLKTLPNSAKQTAFNNYFYDDNLEPHAPGQILKNGDYANTLKHIANNGSRAFYEGDIAKSIVNAVQNNSTKAGVLSLDDLAHYKTKQREAICTQLKTVTHNYKICGAPPPSSTASVFSILRLLAIKGVNKHTRDAEFIHYFSEAANLAFEDRNTWIADPDFSPIDNEALLNQQYLQQRATCISQQKSTEACKSNSQLNSASNVRYINSASPELPSTTHLSIIDEQGNAVSMTSSIEMMFGSQIFVNGFLLNNQLTDFSFTPNNTNGNVANRIEAGKRPRSSMSPIIVFKNDMPIILIGSPGGKRIIHYVARTLANYLLRNKPLQTAIESAHIVQLPNLALEMESVTNKKLTTDLRKRGHTIKQKTQTSGIHAIIKHGNQWKGIADPRREGTAQGY